MANEKHKTILLKPDENYLYHSDQEWLLLEKKFLTDSLSKDEIKILFKFLHTRCHSLIRENYILSRKVRNLKTNVRELQRDIPYKPNCCK